MAVVVLALVINLWRQPYKEKLGDFAFDTSRLFSFTKLMDGESAEKNVRLAAAREVMDRLWGKPTQAVQLSGKDGGPITISELVHTASPTETKTKAAWRHELQATPFFSARKYWAAGTYGTDNKNFQRP